MKSSERNRTERCRRGVAAAFLLSFTPVVPGWSAASGAAEPEPAFDRVPGGLPEGLMENAAGCGSTFEASVGAGVDCLSGEFGGFLIGEALQLAERRGRALFGSRFQVAHRLSWSPFGEGLSGSLDAVVPVTGFGEGAARIGADAGTRALFLQQGITRWRDGEGLQRNDMRFGAAWRFSPSNEPGGDVFGLHAIMQENLERGHRRYVAGVDYMGRWGSGSLQQFVPATDWLPGSVGYEERAVGGTKLGLQLDATTTLSVDTSFARWDEDRYGRPVTDGRVALDWRPHPWLSFAAGFAGIGDARDSAALRAMVRVPLGGGAKKPSPWLGLGVAGGSRATADPWSPIENVERLETVERAIVEPEGPSADRPSHLYQEVSKPQEASRPSTRKGDAL